MGIGEVNSISNTGYVGQGSQVKTTPVTNPVSATADSTQKTVVAPELVDVNPVNTENKTSVVEEEKNNATSSLKEAVEKINMSNSNCEAVFGIHEGTNRVTIKMVDKETNKVIKEFPPEATLDLIAKAWELAGIMVDEKR